MLNKRQRILSKFQFHNLKFILDTREFKSDFHIFLVNRTPHSFVYIVLKLYIRIILLQATLSIASKISQFKNVLKIHLDLKIKSRKKPKVKERMCIRKPRVLV